MTKTRLALLVFCLALTIASAAHAQVSGFSGGGGGLGGPIVQWFVQNILSPLIDVVIIGTGIVIATKTGHIYGCVVAVVGLEVAIHYQEIHSLIS